MRASPSKLAEGLLEWSGADDPSPVVMASARHVAEFILLVKAACTRGG